MENTKQKIIFAQHYVKQKNLHLKIRQTYTRLIG